MSLSIKKRRKERATRDSSVTLCVASMLGRDVTVSQQGEGGGQRILGNETILYDTIIGDTCHYKLVQTHRIYNT